MKRGERCVVVLSGGPDSTTVAYWAKRQGYETHALTFNYGQIAQKEIEYAVKTAERLGIQIKIIDISSLKAIYTGTTSLVDEAIPMTSDFSQTIIVPFRNGVFLSIAVAYAVSIRASRIFYGAHGSDESYYPDCRKEFYKAFETAAKLGTEQEIVIEAPFRNLPKSEIIKEGAKLGVPLQETWSCYLNGWKHCGRCESCMNRKEAFREARIPDPTEYQE